ncbi:hypothetical protein ACH5RR_000093 [Cinchona calisaya]|uniref:NAD-dependent epimerase/dehydratase domain-containing protein n=1 Tax=Cinchona calisaya TaxID=153742 RepID=A0ABD3B0M7_9GENT
MMENIKVCVTGAAGYLGSSLVHKLLEKGYTVHATLRNLGDATKVELLKSLPYADTRLVLFQADIYNPDEFAQAIQGCQVVFHLATPLQHNTQTSQYKNTSEAAVAGVKSIADSCIKSGTVKRLIYTASVTASSALKDDGNGYKDFMDETCWTPLNVSFRYATDFLMAYVHSKTLAEKEALSYNDGNKLEVVSLVCGLVGGYTRQSSVAGSIAVLISQITKDMPTYRTLRFLEEEIGKVPIVHIEDVVEAHIFCMENTGFVGRFLCASDLLKSAEIAALVQSNWPDITIPDEFIEDSKREIKWGSTKLEELGFQYKYDAEIAISDTLQVFRGIQQNA